MAQQTLEQIDEEILRCAASPAYFVHTYCRIADGRGGRGIPFRLWPAQVEVIQSLAAELLLCLLKARQIGMTTLVVCYAVWVAIFRPGSTILLFSKSHKEAKEMLKRIRATIMNLPVWLRPRFFDPDATQELGLSNGSRFVSFGSRASGGDSYTAALVIVDEADLIPDLDLLLSGAKPTIDGGGQLVILSRVDKAQPDSSFKKIYKASLRDGAAYKGLFFPWWSRPGRTRQWYEALKKEIEDRTGGTDELFANYPETPDQALAPPTLSKRLPITWLEMCFDKQSPISPRGTPFSAWPGIEIYRMPEKGEEYIIGVDVAAGNPNSDDSVCEVWHKHTLEQVAVLCGKIEPTVLATHADKLSHFYNRAMLNVERNRHGSTTLAELRHLGTPVFRGRDRKPGWWTDPIGKTMMYDAVAEALRDSRARIHAQATFDQLAAIDVADLKAHGGMHDDRAVAAALALFAATRPLKSSVPIIVTTGDDAKTTTSTQPFVGVKHYPTYGWYAAQLVADGEIVDFGSDYTEESHAAVAVNLAYTHVGQEPPNAVPQLEDTVAAEIADRVQQTFRDRLGGRKPALAPAPAPGGA